MSKPGCPLPESLLAWFDGETADQSIADHTRRCPYCQEVLATWQRENSLLLAVLDELPAMPDLTSKLMSGLKARQPGLGHLRRLVKC